MYCVLEYFLSFLNLRGNNVWMGKNKSFLSFLVNVLFFRSCMYPFMYVFFLSCILYQSCSKIRIWYCRISLENPLYSTSFVFSWDFTVQILTSHSVNYFFIITCGTFTLIYRWQVNLSLIQFSCGKNFYLMGALSLGLVINFSLF